MTTHWFAVTGSCLLTYQRDNLLICLSPSMFKVCQALKIYLADHDTKKALKCFLYFCSYPHFHADEQSGYHQAVAVAEQCHYFLEETDTFVNFMVASHGCFVRRQVNRKVSQTVNLDFSIRFSYSNLSSPLCSTEIRHKSDGCHHGSCGQGKSYHCQINTSRMWKEH